nr:filaggrin-like [Vicugna pacos]
MSTLLENITAIINLFHHYSNTDKETDTLSKKELKELLEVEFQPILQDPDDPDIADVFMNNLDIDHNMKIDFPEFFLMVFKLAEAYYESTRRQNFQASGKKHKKHRYNKNEDNENEDVEGKQEETEEKRKRKSSNTPSDEKGDTVSSKSQRGKNRHRSRSGTKREKDDNSNSIDEDERTEKHSGSSGKNKKRSRSTEVTTRHNKSRIRGNEEKELALVYDDTKQKGAKWRQSGYNNSYNGGKTYVFSDITNQLDETEETATSREKNDSRHKNTDNKHTQSTTEQEKRFSEYRRGKEHNASISEDRNNVKHPKDSGRISTLTQPRTGFRSNNQHWSDHGWSKDISRNSDYQQRHRVLSTERDSVHGESAFTTGQRQGRRHGQQRDSSRHSGTGHRQTSTLSGSGRPRESSVSQASDSDASYEDAGRPTVTTHGRSGSTSRHQHGASHGQAGDSSGHSASHQGQRGAQRESDSVHGESGFSTGQRQGRRHEQQRDSSRHSGTGHRQTSTVSGSGRHRESSVSQASDSDASYDEAGRRNVTTHGRSGSSSRHQHGASHGQAGVSSTQSDSLQQYSAAPTDRDSVHGDSRSSSGQGQGHRHEQQKDGSKHSGTGYGQSSAVFNSHRHRCSTVGNVTDSAGYSQTAGRQLRITYRKSGSSSRNQTHDTVQDWRHGSYGSADYDYGQSRFGESQSQYGM